MNYIAGYLQPRRERDCRRMSRLLRNRAASDAIAGIAGRIGLVVVGFGVDHQGRPAKADDYKSDPAGNAGDRIACGVIAK